MLEWAIQQSSLSGTRTAFTPAQLAIAAVAVSSTGPSNRPVAGGTMPLKGGGTHEYSAPERLAPHSTTGLLLASISWLPDTCSPEVGLGAARTGVTPWTTAPIPPTTSAPAAASTTAVRLTSTCSLLYRIAPPRSDARADGAVQAEHRRQQVRAAVVAHEADVRRAAAGRQLLVEVRVRHPHRGARLAPRAVPAAGHLLQPGRPVQRERPAVDRVAARVGGVHAGGEAAAPGVYVGRCHRPRAARRGPGRERQRRRRPRGVAGAVAGQHVDRVAAPRVQVLDRERRPG